MKDFVVIKDKRKKIFTKNEICYFWRMQRMIYSKKERFILNHVNDLLLQISIDIMDMGRRLNRSF